MSKLVSASPPTTTLCCVQFQSKTQQSCSFSNPLNPFTVPPRTLPCSSTLKLKGLRFGGAIPLQRSIIQCNSSTRPDPPSGSGDADSRTVLDAFFLGRAVAEALSERIESAVGEFFSTVGRLQAEQQKQVQEFQEDVLERAKKAKEKAAREAMEAQGLVPKSSTANATLADVSSSSISSPASTSTDTPASPSALSDPINPSTEMDSDPVDKDPVLGVSDED